MLDIPGINRPIYHLINGGIRPVVLARFAGFTLVGGIVGYCAGVYSVSNTKVVPCERPKFDADAMFSAVAKTIVAHIDSSSKDAKGSEGSKIVNDGLNKASVKILDSVSESMDKRIRAGTYV